MCQAKLEEESVRRGFKSSVVSEYITNLAKEISKQHVEDANWLILVAYVRVLEKKKKEEEEPKKNGSVFKQNSEETLWSQNSFSR